MTPRAHAVAASLADALLSGPWDPAACADRVVAVVGRRRWVAPVVRLVLGRFPAPPYTRRRALIDEIGASSAFRKAMARGDRPALAFPFLGAAEMGPRRFDVPPVPTVGDLARWLTPDRDGTDTLEWLADRRNWLRGLPPGPLHHYWWRWDGARLIEAPKGRLRAIHRTILREVLDRVPPHPAAHGFVAGRSPLTFASGHVGQPVVVRVDLRQFFPSIGADRVQAVFRALGYPEGVAGTLAALCTSRVPAVVGARAPSLPDRWATLRRLASAHLPQGAPTSPSLANLVAWGLDVRLTALARAHGCSYSRYADDLAFSGAFATGTERFVAVVTRIVADEGFSVNPRKTRVRTRAARQVLAGVVVNARPTIARADVDALRALLHNCRVHGPGSQNRDGRPDWRAVLIGRVAWVRQVDPRRAGRLERDLAAIDWTA